MQNITLTDKEIYELDNLDEIQYLDYISNAPKEKREIIKHIYSKNRALRVAKVRLDEADRALGIIEG